MYREIVRTKAENILARALKKARLIVRQTVFIKGWEVDLLVAGRIVVEVDGFIHLQESVKAKDRRKDKELEEAGYTVIRLTNDDCYYDEKSCVKKIKQAVEVDRQVMKRMQNNTQELQPWQLTLSKVNQSFSS